MFDYFTMLSLEVEESTYGGRVNPSEIGYSLNDRADLPELGYSPDGPVTKFKIKRNAQTRAMCRV